MKTCKRLKKLSFWLIGMFVALVAIKTPAYAASSLGIDIKVSINAAKALTVGTTVYDFGAQSVNTSSVSATSILVTNSSLALQETYTITGANAPSTGGGSLWTLASSTGPIDQYVLGAQFSTAAPANTDAAWNTSITTNSVAGVCSATQFGNGTLAQAGASVSPVSSTTRNLWFRMITPAYVTDTTQRNATLTLAVQ